VETPSVTWFIATVGAVGVLVGVGAALLARRLGRGEARIGAEFDQSRERATNAFAGVEANVKSVSFAVDAVGSRVSDVASDVGKVATAIVARVEGVRADVAHLDEKLDGRIDRWAAETSQALTGLALAQTSQGSDTERALARATSELEARLSGVRDALQRGTEERCALAHTAAETAREVASVRQHVEASESLIGSSSERLEGHLNAVQEECGKVATLLAHIKGDLIGQNDTFRSVVGLLGKATASGIETVAERGGLDPTTVKDKVLRRALEDQAYFQETLATCRIRPLSLARLFPGIEAQSVEIGAIDSDTSHRNHVDMLYVCAMARHRHARYIFEFGTYLGRTTYHLALGPDVKQVFTLDLEPNVTYPAGLKLGAAVQAVHQRDLQGCFFRGKKQAGLITQLHGDSRTFDYTPYVGRVDFAFVDGGHSYELIANDTDRAFSMLKKGGAVVWHDFAPKGRDVVAFAREFSTVRSLFWIENTSLLVYLDNVDAMTYESARPAYDRSLIKGPTA